MKTIKKQNQLPTASESEWWFGWLRKRYTIHSTKQTEVKGGVLATAWVTPLEDTDEQHEQSQL